MPDIVSMVRGWLGVEPDPEPPLSDEQSTIAARQDRIKARLKERQRAIDIQVDVLAADRRDALHHR